jgi:hypothetical protein
MKTLRCLGWTFAVIAALWLLLVYINWPGRRGRRFLIPEGYMGVFRVQGGIPGEPALPIEDGKYLFRIPVTGQFRTSTAWDDGMGEPDEFYYVFGTRRRKLLETSDGYATGKPRPQPEVNCDGGFGASEQEPTGYVQFSVEDRSRLPK